MTQTLQPRWTDGSSSDLPSIAALAALELDNILVGEEVDTGAIAHLAYVFSKDNDHLSLLFDPTTAMAMHMAIAEADPHHPSLSNSSELVLEAENISKYMQCLVENPVAATDKQREEIEWHRDFILDLSERVAAGKKSLYGWEPQHPWQR